MAKHPEKRQNFSARRAAFMGLLFALAAVLGFAESFLMPPLPMGIKLGLSNIVTMYCLFFIGPKEGFAIASLKSLFALMTRSPMTALIGFSGGVCSVAVMTLCTKISGKHMSYLLISVFGAVSHNMGQIVAVRYILGTQKLLYLAPLLVVSGVFVGTLTGFLLKTAAPYMDRLNISG